MRKVKLFKSVVNELETLEREINHWLESSGHQLISISGNIAAQTSSGGNSLDHFPTSDLFLIVTYEDANG